MVDHIVSRFAMFVLGFSPVQLLLGLVIAIVVAAIVSVLWIFVEDWWLR